MTAASLSLRRRLQLAALPALAALLAGCIEFAEAGSNAAGNFFLDLILLFLLLLVLAVVVVAALFGLGLYGLAGKGRAAEVAAGISTVAGALIILGGINSATGLLLGGSLVALGLLGLRRARDRQREGAAPPPQAPPASPAARAVVLRRIPPRR